MADHPGITFVYRSDYNNPSGKFVRRLKEKTILEWFQANWKLGNQERTAGQWLGERELGRKIYGFWYLFETIHERQIPKPKNNAELQAILGELGYPEGYLGFESGAVEAFTDDDEYDLRWFFVEAAFADKHPEKCRYLLQDGPLPTAADASKSNERCTYIYAHGPVNGESQLWDRVVVPETRLRDFQVHLQKFCFEGIVDRNANVVCGREADEVKEFVQQFENTESTWPDVLQKLCFSEHGPPEAIEKAKAKSMLWCSEHLCVAFAYLRTYSYPAPEADHYRKVIIHDDIWAATHPDFAASLAWYSADNSIFS